MHKMPMIYLICIYVDHKTTCRNVIEVVKQNSGKQIMLLPDCFDELPPNLRSESVFVNLIQGKTLVNCAIVVTSRPYATLDLQSLRCFSRHLGVQGFSQNKIKDCIYEAFPGEVIKAARLMEDLERREDIYTVTVPGTYELRHYYSCLQRGGMLLATNSYRAIQNVSYSCSTKAH